MINFLCHEMAKENRPGLVPRKEFDLKVLTESVSHLALWGS
jgi:hypothetical protein